jgi:tetratricopeptide (TPR) repeat protein
MNTKSLPTVIFAAIIVGSVFTSIFNPSNNTETSVTQSQVSNSPEDKAAYDEAIQSNPNDGDAYYNRGFLYQNQGKTELALADYNKAIALSPNHAMAYTNRGFLYSKQGKEKLALPDYNQAIALNPNYLDAYTNRGNFYQNQGKSDLALTDYNQAIALNPNDAEAYSNLGLLYRKMGNTEAAKTSSLKAQELFTAQGKTADAEQVANFLQQLP